VKQVGIHLRIAESIVPLAHQAVALQLPFFQSFLGKKNGVYVPSLHEIKLFRALCESHFSMLFAHGSYWLNMADPSYTNSDALLAEVRCAQHLGFTHLVLHPGSTRGVAERQIGIEAVARMLNKVFKRKTDLHIVLENTAHGNYSIGSDIADLAAIKMLVDRPDLVTFCIDTAHAHAYGYDLCSPSALDRFICYLDATLGISNIVLVHLNDTHDGFGSHCDRHAYLGQGTLGKDVLHAIYHHPAFMKIPIILEPPLLLPEQLSTLVQMVRTW